MPPRHHGFVGSIPEDALRYRVKVELRKRMRALRGALPLAARLERSRRIGARLLALEAVAQAQAVALFWPMQEKNEVDLRSVEETLRARGTRIAFPCALAETRKLTFRFVRDPGALLDRGAGFCEPDPSEPEAQPGELDVIVVPALAVDPSGHRIGYGLGYYDATLPDHAAHAVSIAVAFDFQLIAEVPATSGDVPTNWIVTDARTIRAGG
jgi:5-formyltetrahydrofolate cyclo-ligase